MVSPGRYVLGAVALLIVCASLGWAALVVRRRYAPAWSGAPARLAEAVIGFALLTAELELLGTVRLFRLAPVVIGSLVIGLVVTRAFGGGPAAEAGFASVSGVSAPNRSLVPAVGAGIALLAVLAEWSGPTFSSFDFGIRSFDSVWYHLPWAASFAQTGQITSLRLTDVEYLTAFYPATAEMFHGAGIVLLSRDTLSPIFNLVWLGLVLLAAFCVGRPRGLGWLTMTGAAVACSVPMFVGSQAGSAANDIVGIFFVLAAAAVFFGADEDAAFPLALGGIAAGLAIATKLSMVIPALALTGGVVVLRRRRSWLWLGPLAVVASFWYVRNLIAVGNPFPFVGLPGLATPAPPLQAHTGFSVAHYLFNGHAWSEYFQPGFASGLGGWWWAVLALMLLGPVLALLPGSDARVRLLGLVALASIVGYLLTPETAAGPAGEPLGFAFNLRYGAPALILSLTVLPLAPALRDERVRYGLIAVFGAVLIATLVQPRLWPSRQLARRVRRARASPPSCSPSPAGLVSPPSGRPRSSSSSLDIRSSTTTCTAATRSSRGSPRSPGHGRSSAVFTMRASASSGRSAASSATRTSASTSPIPSSTSPPAVRTVRWNRSPRARGGGGRSTPATTATSSPHRPATRGIRSRCTPRRRRAGRRPIPAAHLIYARRAAGQQIAVFAIDRPLNPLGCR